MYSCVLYLNCSGRLVSVRPELKKLDVWAHDKMSIEDIVRTSKNGTAKRRLSFEGQTDPNSVSIILIVVKLLYIFFIKLTK